MEFGEVEFLNMFGFGLRTRTAMEDNYGWGLRIAKLGEVNLVAGLFGEKSRVEWFGGHDWKYKTFWN